MTMSGPMLIDLRAFLAPERILFLDGQVNKREALLRLAELTTRCRAVGDKKAFVRAIFQREEVSSTGIGGGIAVPHAKLPSIEGFVITVGVSRTGIPFAGKDGRPVNVLVMIAASDRERETYLRVLATVAARLKDPAVCEAIVAASEPEQVIEALATA